MLNNLVFFVKNLMFFELFYTFFACFLINFLLIYIFHKREIFQPQREETSNQDVVVTFGGVSFLFVLLHFLFQDFSLIFFILIIGLIGLFDDILKVYKKNSHGLSSKFKFSVEFLCSICYLWHLNLNLSYLPYFCGLIWGAFILVSCINAVNITDGIDALAASISLWSLLFLYLKTGDFMVLSLIISVIAFLCFNFPPAKLYMGDVGSLTLGAFIGSMFLKYNLELVFPFIGIIFVFQTLSSLLQIVAINKFKKKIFLMAPFHHHLIILGYSRNSILLLFNIVTILFFIICYLIV